MNNQNTTTPAATPSTPAKDHAGAVQPVETPKTEAAPAKVEAIPAKA
jgi:hypothetical protein